MNQHGGGPPWSLVVEAGLKCQGIPFHTSLWDCTGPAPQPLTD